MKQLLTLVVIFLSFHCKADFWTRKADFAGGIRTEGSRGGAYGFSIGMKAYVGGGTDTASNFKNDLWEYDPATNAWQQKANTPFTTGQFPAGFSIGNKGYVVTLDSSLTNELWVYDPSSDSWTRKANVPGGPFIYPVAFVVGNFAYVGNLSSSNSTTDFYSYNPTTDSWSSVGSISGRYTGGSAFVVSNNAYLLGLFNYDSSFCADSTWMYNSSLNSLAARLNSIDSFRTDATALAIGGIGYFGLGDPGTGGHFKDWWQYVPATNSWLRKASIPSLFGKDENVSFVINNKGYVCFGSDLFSDAEVWEYTPDSTSSVETYEMQAQFFKTNIYPNPFTASATFIFSRELSNAALNITDICGKEIATYENISGKDFILNRSTLSAAIYFYQLWENGVLLARNKIIVQ